MSAPLALVEAELELRSAAESDVGPIVALVDSYARRALLLPRPEPDVRAHLGDFHVAVRDARVVACAALQTLGPGLAEIRTLAVAQDEAGRGVGSWLVERLVERAGELGFAEVLALTRRVGLFERAGFRATRRERFADKLAADCQACPKSAHCDETAVVRAPPPAHRRGPAGGWHGGVRAAARPAAPEAGVAGQEANAAEPEVAATGTGPRSKTVVQYRRGAMSDVKKVVLAYSGGLDTSIIIPWIQEHYGGAEIIAYCGDVGQGDDFDAVRAKALATGASECVIEDLREEFVRDYCFEALSAGAIYEDKYLLGTALARPLLAHRQVQLALERGADALAHGATGKGNDQVRFEVTYGAFAPHLRVIAPWREWDIRSREQALAYAEAHGVPVEHTRADLYSRDGNLWHLSHEGGVLEDPWNSPPRDVFRLTADPVDAPDEPETVTVGFEGGRPVALHGEALGPVEIVAELNRVAGRHGVGRLDLVENRLVGMKSRGVYETPAGTVLHAAHRELERLVLDRDTLHFKRSVSVRYAQLIYDGLWFSTLREALAAFVAFTEQPVTGEVRMRLYKGSVEAVGRRSPHSLYLQDLATFGEGMDYDHADAGGFIRLYGLPERVRALAEERLAADARR